MAVATTQQVGLIDPQKLDGWAEVFRKSGLFQFDGDVNTQMAQAKVKILAGMEMGLQPFHAMQSLYIVKGHVFVSASAMGALINGSRYAKFVTKESTADKATIEFYRREGEKWELVHTQTYTWEEVPATRRQNATYTSDRPDMIWNRCMTKGGKKAFPELLGGMRAVEEAYDAAEFTEVSGNGHNLIPEDVEAAPNVAAIPQGEIAADPVEPDRQSVAATSEKPRRKAKAKAEAEPEQPKDEDAENADEGFIEHHSDSADGPMRYATEKGSITPATKAKVIAFYKADDSGLKVVNLVKTKGWSLGGTADLSEYQGQVIIAVCEGRDEKDVAAAA
jgi:hypothetical protein